MWIVNRLAAWWVNLIDIAVPEVYPQLRNNYDDGMSEDDYDFEYDDDSDEDRCDSGMSRSRSDDFRDVKSGESSFYDSMDEEEDEEEEDEAEQQRRMLLESQRDLEREALSGCRFAKLQRVRYYHKMSDTWINGAHIVGVHYDDGPDKPYYTIQYNDDCRKVEKQTTVDRLKPSSWEEDKTWEILSAKL